MSDDESAGLDGKHAFSFNGLCVGMANRREERLFRHMTKQPPHPRVDVASRLALGKPQYFVAGRSQVVDESCTAARSRPSSMPRTGPKY